MKSKRQKGEKAKTKLKKGKTAPGKHLPKGTNVTKTEFKVGKIVIPKQLQQTDQVRRILIKSKAKIPPHRKKYINEKIKKFHV